MMLREPETNRFGTKETLCLNHRREDRERSLFSSESTHTGNPEPKKILPGSERTLYPSHQGEHTAKRYPKAHSLSLHVFPLRYFHPSARGPGSWGGCTQRWFLILHESDNLILANSFLFFLKQQQKSPPRPFSKSLFPHL